MNRSPLKTKLLLAAATLLLGASAPALCVQIVEGGDGATIYAKISKKEVTRLALDRGHISTFRVKDGELIIDPDDETGQLFITVPETTKKPVNGFLTTDAGITYTVILQPTDTPADSIVIKQPRAKRESAKNEYKSTTYDKTVKRLVSVMATDELPDDVEIKEVGSKFDLWQEASMMLERQYLTDTLVGERYQVANVSKEPMTLDEREFYRKGVTVVAIENHNLMPNASTKLYVIREKKPNE